MSACLITVERLEDDTYLATCTIFPQLEAVGETEDDARQALEEEIARHLADQDHPGEPSP
jgi:predicted RNase H-like HicB family nuclease